jgi:hypothetical protein
MTLRALFPLLAAAFVVAYGTGCLASSAVYFTSDKFTVYEDRLVAIDDAWTDGERLIFAFRAELGVVEILNTREKNTDRELIASLWWMEVPLEPTKMDGLPLHAGVRGPIRWDRGVDGRVKRGALREGVPPSEAIAGMRRVPILDAGSLGRELGSKGAQSRVAWTAARNGVAIYSPAFWVDSSDYGGPYAMSFGVARFDSRARGAELDEFQLAQRFEQPYRYVGLLMPLAMAVDIVLLPVYIPAYIVVVIIATANEKPERHRREGGTKSRERNEASPPASAAAPGQSSASPVEPVDSLETTPPAVESNA